MTRTPHIVVVSRKDQGVETQTVLNQAAAACARRAAGAMLFLVVFAAGCATNPDVGSLSSEQRARFDSLAVLRGPATRPYSVLGPVKGLSCHRNAAQRQELTETEAIAGVKLRAAALDADAVINTVCQVNSGTDWANNCWASIVCVGDAIRYTQ